jgi:prepilin-type N-terminal cleavage/methylation domain-containing protein
MPSRRARRRGFSLLELLTTITVLGIIGGIAAPVLRAATHRADASKVAADMTTVRAAMFEFREDTGRLPRTTAWGRVPPDLAPYFNSMLFTYKELDYRVVTTAGRGRVDFLVRYPRDSQIGAALRRFRRPGDDSGSVNWSTTQTRWRLLEDNQ